jgi:hypothetical protein
MSEEGPPRKVEKSRVAPVSFNLSAKASCPDPALPFVACTGLMVGKSLEDVTPVT